ncbi:MAG: hypothetical protein QM813_14310 [Verrucomicrobiota bacterium]
MNPRLTKEFRPLLFPWALAAAASVGHLLASPNSAYFHGAFGDFVTGLAGFAFIAGVLVLAAMPMGAELHERTLALLFSQPIERARLWKTKLLTASAMIAALALVHGLATAAMGRLYFLHALLYLAFIVVAISSVGYHTLATRSVLVGIASAAGTPFVITLSTYLIVRYLFGVELELSDQAALALILSASGVYAALSLWLSRRQFVGLELRDAAISRAAEVPAALVPKALSELFHPRPTGVVLNLIRKEVCLHKPIFLVSAIFTAVWLLTLLLMLLQPAWHDNCAATLNGLTNAHVVLMTILGGCVALGDDKALGTAMWHLTLPVSARRQWFIKLFTAFTTFVGVAIVLPILLAVLTLFKARVGLLAIPAGEAWGLFIPCALVFVVSFWSASMVTNTVQAALTCVLAIAVLGAAAAAGIWAAEYFDGLQTYLLLGITAFAQSVPVSIYSIGYGLIGFLVILLAVGYVYVPLRQSLTQLRRGQSSSRVFQKNALVLVSLAFVGTFWFVDLKQSEKSVWNSTTYRDGEYYGTGPAFITEVTEATVLVWRTKPDFENKQSFSISLQELEQTGKLSWLTKIWLRKSHVTVDVDTSLVKQGKRSGQPYHDVKGTIHLPNNKQVPFWYWKYKTETEP